MPPVITQAEFGLFPAVDVLPEIPLDTPAWLIESYDPIYADLEHVGDDQVIPGVTGRNAVEDELDEGIFDLRATVFGEADLEGTPYPDARVGVRKNLRYLRANLWTPIEGSPTRPFEFHELGGDVYAGDVKVRAVSLGKLGPTAVRYTLRIIVPAGLLTLVP